MARLIEAIMRLHVDDSDCIRDFANDLAFCSHCLRDTFTFAA
jgi:hypothetical protein